MERQHPRGDSLSRPAFSAQVICTFYESRLDSLDRLRLICRWF